MNALKALLAAGAIALPACAQTPVQALSPGETSIYYAANGGIRDWHADNDRSIYLMDRGGRWYLATFDHACTNLPSAQTIHFDTAPTGTLDRFSSIRTEESQCLVASVRAAAAPAAKGGPKR